MADAYPSFGYDPDGTARRRIPTLADVGGPQTLGNQVAQPPVPGLKGAATEPLIPQPQPLHSVGQVVAANTAQQAPLANPATIPVPSGPAVVQPLPAAKPATLTDPVAQQQMNQSTAPGQPIVQGLPPAQAKERGLLEPPRNPYIDNTTPLEDRTLPGPSPFNVRSGNIGLDTTGMTSFERKQAELAIRERAAAGVKIRSHGDTIEEMPPEQSPSRWRQVLVGLGRGALAGAAGGQGLGGAIGGAITGGIIGGVSPNMMQALTRQDNIDRLRGDVATEQEMQLKGAQTGLAQAQAQADIARAQGEAWKMRNSIAGIYVNPRTGEVTRMDPKDAVERTQADQAQEGKQEYNQTYTDPTGKVYTGLSANQAATRAQADRNQGAGGTQGAIAREGLTEAQIAGADRTTVQAEYDHYATQLEANQKALEEKKQLWREQMRTKVWTDKINNAALLGGKIPHYTIDGEDFPLELIKDDPHFKSGELQQTVDNTDAIRKKLPVLQTRLHELDNATRTGTGKASRVPGQTATVPAQGRISRANLPALAQRLNLPSVAAAEKFVTDNGGTVY
jgi:hypothetical protein